MNNLKGNWHGLLINVEVSGFFKSTKGIKQGDPFSPFLFIICPKVFSRVLTFLVQQQSIVSYALPRGCSVVSHLAFADDVIVFLRGDLRSVRNFKEFISTYELGTGQKINMSKSSLYVSKRCSTSQDGLIERILRIK
ncbi:hypothetical protein ACH5RR_037373 [Cinchona calisaya]|uniref:Reverse transcriptase domain-containing protein n=1 Tax=Cinchona calisaya TaxID=153742 RepID=A0ABD2YA82_9GENT